MTTAILSEMWAKVGYDGIKHIPLEAFSGAAIKAHEVCEPNPLLNDN